jgi:hypothetical protein
MQARLISFEPPEDASKRDAHQHRHDADNCQYHRDLLRPLARSAMWASREILQSRSFGKRVLNLRTLILSLVNLRFRLAGNRTLCPPASDAA